MITLPQQSTDRLAQAHKDIDAALFEEGVVENRAIHDILDQLASDVHEISLSTAGQRVLTIQEAADALGIDSEVCRLRIKEAQSLGLIEPVKVINNSPLYMVEDLPFLAHAHIAAILAEGLTPDYVNAVTRKTVDWVLHNHKARIRIQQEKGIKWPQYHGVPISISVQVSQGDWPIVSRLAKRLGFSDVPHLARALLKKASYADETAQRKLAKEREDVPSV